MMAKYIMEGIGTLVLVFSIMATTFLQMGVISILIVSLALMAMIYAGGHISKAHYNPATTLAFALRGRIGFSDVLYFWLFQILGGVLALMISYYLFDGHSLNNVIGQQHLLKALVAEYFGTSMMIFVILLVATTDRTSGNVYFGIAIAAIVFAMGSLFGSISGAAFNPAVTIVFFLNDMLTINQCLYYILVQAFASSTAYGLFKLVYKGN